MVRNYSFSKFFMFHILFIFFWTRICTDIHRLIHNACGGNRPRHTQVPTFNVLFFAEGETDNVLKPCSSVLICVPIASLYNGQNRIFFVCVILCVSVANALFPRSGYSSAFSVTFQCCLSLTQKCKLLHILYLKGIIFLQITKSFVAIQFYLLFQVDRNRIGII